METRFLLALLVLLLIVAGVIFRVAFWPAIRRRRILSAPFPEHWQKIIQQRLSWYQHLPQEVQSLLRDQVKLFLSDKRFVGCAGQEIDDDIRVTIATQACLLTVNRSGSPYPALRSVLVYPSTFVTTREVRDELGLVSTERTAMLGESWSHGKVVLAWDNVAHGVLNVHDGLNVVLHEFAHQLDHESGATNGAPLLDSASDYKSWSDVFSREFERLQFQADQRQATLLDHYGATNPAEFFAVATETFFERPGEMAWRHRELYLEMTKYYQLDPTGWARPT